MAGGHGETVQHGAAVRAAAGDDVVAVAALNIGCAFGDAIAVGIRIVSVDVAGENGDIGFPVPLASGCLRPRKAAVEGYAFLQRKGGAAVVVGLAAALVGIIDARGHPDFVAALGQGQGVLHGGEGVGPGTAVVVPAGVFVHVDDAVDVQAGAATVVGGRDVAAGGDGGRVDDILHGEAGVKRPRQGDDAPRAHGQIAHCPGEVGCAGCLGDDDTRAEGAAGDAADGDADGDAVAEDDAVGHTRTGVGKAEGVGQDVAGRGYSGKHRLTHAQV